ncbi:hypothetical protein CL634_07445 [bacterium]|nr:hypothetical protein [bacterium]|tara:strand:+ start:225 stop:740 length:516 start_codon:yes stop_codon:yes gene_type:complete
MQEVQVKVAFIIGSQSDKKRIPKGFYEMLDAVLTKDGWETHMASAHRHIDPNQDDTLMSLCNDLLDREIRYFIAAAGGGSCGLPGAVSGLVMDRGGVVIGVPLDSEGLQSVIGLPPGIPCACPGVGEWGLLNAAQLACQILAVNSASIQLDLNKFRELKPKRVIRNFEIRP